jgi:hypothetical protein
MNNTLDGHGKRVYLFDGLSRALKIVSIVPVSICNLNEIERCGGFNLILGKHSFAKYKYSNSSQQCSEKVPNMFLLFHAISSGSTSGKIDFFFFDNLNVWS